MTAKENYRHYFNKEAYGWMPSDLDLRFFHPEEFPDYVCRGFVHQEEPFPAEKFGGTGWFNVQWFYDPKQRGAIDLGHVIPDIEDWRQLKFPDLDAYDWEGIAKKNAAYLSHDKVPATTIYTGLFERLIAVLDFEDAAVALIDPDQQEDVKDFFEALTDFYIDYIRRFQKYFGLQHLTFHDDWGTQDTVIISPETHREMILPYVKKIVDACHEMGIVYEQHSCGYILSLLPQLFEAGADLWQGQSIPGLKEKAKAQYPEFHHELDLRDLPYEAGETPEEAAEVAFRALQPYAGKGYYLAARDFRLSREASTRLHSRIMEEGFC